MPNIHILNIKKLLKDNGYPDNHEILPLPQSGSNRMYFRILFHNSNNPESLIVSFNDDVRENIAHHSFTIHFRNQGLRVPEIYAFDSTRRYYLLQDLGPTNLLAYVKNNNPVSTIYYKEAIKDLIKFQVEGIKNLDLDVAYPVSEFNRKSVMWDLYYFKYNFLKPHNINFDEDALENDFNAFADEILSTEKCFFTYRDFQARNIMIYNRQPWYIDFQGGRKGPLQYDVVSLLYQVAANLNEKSRSNLLKYYLDLLEKTLPGKSYMFMNQYNNYVYFRLMQVMGAYGFRGKVQRKSHFLKSIPLSINQLKKFRKNNPLNSNFYELNRCMDSIARLNYNLQLNNSENLMVMINSFSFKLGGIPIDVSGNGGGFVFDCRSLPNPGRIEGIRDYSGQEKPVIDYLKGQKEVDKFLESTTNLVTQSIDNYIDRGFKNLQLNFGCTGGKHRSVYTAEHTADYIRKNYPNCIVVLNHNELEKN